MAQVDAIARQAGGPVEVLKLAQCGHSPHKDQAEKVTQADHGIRQTLPWRLAPQTAAQSCSPRPITRSRPARSSMRMNLCCTLIRPSC